MAETTLEFPQEILERFWSKVQKGYGDDACWIWTAGKFSTGYGEFKCRGENVGAHRFSYEISIGKLPRGMCVLHKCDVRTCVNPRHLFSGTRDDNAADMCAKGRQSKGDRHYSKLSPEKLSPKYLAERYLKGRIGRKGEEYPQAKLCEVQVVKIRGLIRKGFGNPQIARGFGVSHQLINKIRKGELWKHVNG